MKYKLFIDTNVFVEYYEKRAQFESVRTLFNMLEDGACYGVISIGSFYTLSYILDHELRRKDCRDPERTKIVRAVLHHTLELVDVAASNRETLLRGVSDTSFRDIEDSFQHQAALSSECDFIITLNAKDFSSSKVRVMSPVEFVERWNLTAKK